MSRAWRRSKPFSALTRRLRRLEIKQAEFDDACDELEQDFASQYRVVALTEEIIDEAASLAKKHGLRAYDAAQLAAALDTSRVISQIESTQLTALRFAFLQRSARRKSLTRGS